MNRKVPSKGAGFLVLLASCSELLSSPQHPRPLHASLPLHETVPVLSLLFRHLPPPHSVFMAHLLYPCIHKAMLECSRTPATYCLQGSHQCCFSLPDLTVFAPINISKWKIRPSVGTCMRAHLFQPCPSLCDPMDYSLPGSSVCGILQARIREWVAVPSSRGSSQPRDRTHVFCIAGRFFTTETSGKPSFNR